MSLYNALFGVNPYTPLLLGFLGITQDDVPRFRDCYVEDGLIAVYTRMGGGNRGHWDYSETDEGPDCPCPGCVAENFLTALPGYVRDEDDDFDCTYATYYYQPSEDVAKLVTQLAEIGGSRDPAASWDKLFADMHAGRDNPQVARALEVTAPIIEALSAALAPASVDRSGEAGETPKSGLVRRTPARSRPKRRETPKALHPIQQEQDNDER